MTADIDPTTIDQDVSIDAPPADIFALLAELEPILDACPHTTVTSTEEGIVVIYTWNDGGSDPSVTLRVQPRVIDVEEPTGLTMALDGSIQGTVEWTFQSRDGSTLVTATLSSPLPAQTIEAVGGEMRTEADRAGDVS